MNDFHFLGTQQQHVLLQRRNTNAHKMSSALKGDTKDFLVETYQGVRAMDLGPIGWFSGGGPDVSEGSVTVDITVGITVGSDNQHGTPFSIRSDVDLRSSTILHHACRRGCVPLVRALVSTGIHVDLDEQTDQKTTPLMYAVIYDHLPIVRLLLAQGADPLVRKC